MCVKIGNQHIIREISSGTQYLTRAKGGADGRIGARKQLLSKFVGSCLSSSSSCAKLKSRGTSTSFEMPLQVGRTVLVLAVSS